MCGDGVGDGALTFDLYSAWLATAGYEAALASAIATVTCIPATAFQERTDDVTLSAMPLLEDIGESAFDSFQGVLLLAAGDCPVLRQIGDRAFASLRSAHESVVEFGDLPALAFAGATSFGGFNGTLRVSGPFPSYSGPCSTLRVRGAAIYAVLRRGRSAVD